MNKRAILILGILALILLSFSLGTAQRSVPPTTKLRVAQVPPDEAVSLTPPVAAEAKDYCFLRYHDYTGPFYGYQWWNVGDKVAIYFDPTDCGNPQNYPFQLTDVEFALWDFAGVGTVDVRFSVETVCPDICDGPGIEIYKSPIYTITDFGVYVTIDFPDTICLDKPFFFNLEYMSGEFGSIPSLYFTDTTDVVDTCYQWVWFGQPSWIEWYDVWTPPAPGWIVMGISGYTGEEQTDCGWWYWKPDTTEAPNGMPDFDQNQDEWVAFCGPTAVANCLWWFNAVPTGMTPPDFIELLAGYFSTNVGMTGTHVDSIQAGLERYFADYGFALTETTYWMPDFYEMEDSLKVCQDIILLLGFWWWDDYYQEWYREGGHFVTMAGVNSEKKEIAISDPDRDQCVQYTWWPGRVRPTTHPPWPGYPPTLHNDPLYVSHDVYISLLDPEFPSPGSFYWDLADYCYEWYKYYNMNVPDRFRAVTKPAPKHLEYWHVEVEAAVMICPKPRPDTLPNHFKTWLIDPQTFFQTVHVQDQFMSDSLVLDAIEFFSNPARKDSFEIADSLEHLIWYRAHGRDTLLEVEYSNQFGTDTVRIDSVKYLLLPTAKELWPFPESLDHYKAYRIKDPVEFDRMVELEDQFDLMYDSVEFIESLKPIYFLTPALKNYEEPMFDPITHYVAYEIFPKRVYPIPVNTFDQFGSHSLYTDQAEILLVPTEKLRAEPPPNNPPEIGQPDFLEGYVDSVVEYDITGTDPDGDVILDDASITIIPGCGSGYSITRTSGHGTSSGTWSITWFTDGCTVCDTHMVIHDLTDETGLVGYCTTWVHLSAKPSDSLWYWKPDTTNAPSGMPDFDQYQFGPPDSLGMCGPTAVANCLWWFGAVPTTIDDPGDFIRLLSDYFKTDPTYGTYVDSIQLGLDRYFQDYGFALQEMTYWMPDFYEMEDSLKVCQDIILLLGFWYYDGSGWWREGGHFVTMAGVCSESLKIAISDPARDAAVGGWPGRVRPPWHPGPGTYPPTLHNDPTYVSHDMYQSVLDNPFPSPGNPYWELGDYFWAKGEFTNMNVPERFKTVSKPAPEEGKQVFATEVEAAIMICPKAWNHFKTWRTEPKDTLLTVVVEDQFMQDDLTLDRIDFLSNPTRKDSFEIADSLEHLTWYRAHGRDTLLEVEYTNQFGTNTVRIDSVKYLLLPTAKEEPYPFPENLDHYKAYRIKDPVAFERMVELEDQFDLMYDSVEFIESLKPIYFLTPALKNYEEPMHDSITHYVAYEIFPQRFFPLSVITYDQFEEHFLQVDTSKFLLVPTEKLRAEPPPNDPPEIGQPDFLEGLVDDTVQYDITGTDPNGDVILDSASIVIVPGCGTYSITRTSGHGTSSGTWQVTWLTDGCTPCDTHMVIHDLTDQYGATGYCTTWVHLSEERECDDNDPKECDTLWVECGNMRVPPGGGLVTVDMTIANDESLKAVQVVLSYQGNPLCCDSLPDSENTVAKVFAGSVVENWELKVVSIDHAAKTVSLGATPIYQPCLPPGKGHLATLTLFGDSCCTILMDTTTAPGGSTYFVECYTLTQFYPVCRIDTCHIERNNPPVIDQPDFLEGWVDDVVQYTIDGTDPDGDVIEDQASIEIQPDCGDYSITRVSGSGTSSGTWEITWNTDGCTPCDTHMVIHDLTDVLGATAYCTTWVHLSEPESLYWKPPYEDYAPSGMPDIDQRQDGWMKFDTDQWSFCGPVAVANCFKWFDSKYNVPPGAPGDGFDQFPLVRDYLDNNAPHTGFDDHDPWNVDHTATAWNSAIGPPPPTPQPFVPGLQTPNQVPSWGELVERLAWYFNTDGIQTGYCGHTGTKVTEMQEGIDLWLESEDLQNTLCEVTTKAPTFAYVESLVEKSEDVILLLGFWYYEAGPGGQEFIRGDADEDGDVDEDDVTLIAAGGPFSCDDAADVNDDGVIDLSDAVYLANYVAGTGDPPLPPFPNCGTDPSMDDLDCAHFPPCPSGGQWHRIGGHYVTVAGVNSETYRIAFSDPFIDAAEFGAPGRIGDGILIPHSFPHDRTVHNDEGNVSHDIYTADTGSISPGGDWWLPGYAINGDPGYWSWNFYNQNVPDEFIDVTAPWNGTSSIHTEVEYCVHISPWDDRGDVEPIGGDGDIDLGDLLFIIAYVFKNGPAPVPYSEGDVNCDGKIDLGDILATVAYLYKNGPRLRCCDP